MKEVWVPIKGYEGLYEISNFGRIKSYHYHNGTYSRIIKPRSVKDGYLMVVLTKDKRRKSFQVHQLVAKTFIPNINDYTEVNHKNLNKTDNRASNLEWISHYDNILHYWKFNKRKSVVSL